MFETQKKKSHGTLPEMTLANYLPVPLFLLFFFDADVPSMKL